MNTTIHRGKTSLPLIDMEAELRRFEEEERKRLGLDAATEQWVEHMANLSFSKRERPGITLLIGGLTHAQDYLARAAFAGLGYNVQTLDTPDNAALQVGKEFGNRGQCNPTYFTVGNLVKFLCTLRDKHGMSSEEIVRKYVFLTAGACGPCRFGMYVTEYRKALRDAGFDGFRVMLFQQTGGLRQATGEDPGLDMNPTFFISLLKAIVAGDVLNAIGYRLRPYEVEPGATDRAMAQAKKICHDALENRESILYALWRSKPLFEAVKVDRTRVVPKVSIIGEFWAMTTEGDGNYQLQRFLESEGAECDIQLVTAWVLYNIWESRNDTRNRADLRGADTSRYGLGGLGPFDVAKRLFAVGGAELALRLAFQAFAYAGGLYGYKLPDMEKVARVSAAYYNNDLRGGEGHMEVGKLILNVVESKAHMTVSVKPFGCMPSASVSDGVQSAVVEKYPGTIFCAVETSGDGRVNFYSRVQMFLFKAKQAALAEYERALSEHGVTGEQVRAFLEAHPRFASPLHKAPHVYAGTAADLVAEVAPYITMRRRERWARKAKALLSRAAEAAERAPEVVVSVAKGAVTRAPEIAAKVREDLAIVQELRRQTRASAPPMADAAE
jgi:predicted nucleotide-binding protein (sugar kinase/HSP70/actin superfamily)